MFYSWEAPPHPELNCGGGALVSVRQRLGALCLVLVGMDAVAAPLWAVGTAPQIINESFVRLIPPFLAILHFKECMHVVVCAFLSSFGFFLVFF